MGKLSPGLLNLIPNFADLGQGLKISAQSVKVGCSDFPVNFWYMADNELALVLTASVVVLHGLGNTLSNVSLAVHAK